MTHTTQSVGIGVASVLLAGGIATWAAPASAADRCDPARDRNCTYPTQQPDDGTAALPFIIANDEAGGAPAASGVQVPVAPAQEALAPTDNP